MEKTNFGIKEYWNKRIMEEKNCGIKNNGIIKL